MKRVAVLFLLSSALACSGPPSGLGGQTQDAGTDGPASSDARVDAAPLQPDLSIDMGRSSVDLSVAIEHFVSTSCELEASEQCVAAAGDRKVLRFSVETINLGAGDLKLGTPSEDAGFSFSMCHAHFHFDGYATYRLRNSEGTEVLRGRKQAFCLLDSEPYQSDASTAAIYSCLNQGLQAGWSDVYGANLPCQFLDITDVPDGNYTLEVEINPDGLLADESSANNVGSLAVQIGDTKLDGPGEPCPDLADRYLDRIEKECDWDFAGEFDCTPGTQTGAACSQNCGMGSCTGNPMIRVCDAAQSNCTSALALGDNDNHCGGLCPLATNFLCPSSGRLAVYTTSAEHSQPYTCSVAVGPGPDFP